MTQLKEILEAYRNKQREFPSYGELMALVEAPASTLTDEQITNIALQHSAGSVDGHWCFRHKSLLEFSREVAAPSSAAEKAV